MRIKEGTKQNLKLEVHLEKLFDCPFLGIDPEIGIFEIESKKDLLDKRFRAMHGPLLIGNKIVPRGEPFEIIRDVAIEFGGNKPPGNTVDEELRREAPLSEAAALPAQASRGSETHL